MVVRFIPGAVPAFDTLGLPPVLKDVVVEKRGLILMVGATGSGKSTSLASSWLLGLPCLRSCLSRAACTRCCTCALDSAWAMVVSSSSRSAGTSILRSIRSSKGPEMRAR